jgi:hypothetical protein
VRRHIPMNKNIFGLRLSVRQISYPLIRYMHLQNFILEQEGVAPFVHFFEHVSTTTETHEKRS